jgi:hypothetical protein
MGTTKPLSDFRKLHAYARNSPNGASDDRLDDWLHIVGSEADEEPGHAEMVADLRVLGSDHDFDIADWPDLFEIEPEQFSEVHLDRVLEHVEWKNQSHFLRAIWAWMQDQSELVVTTRSIRKAIVTLRRFCLTPRRVETPAAWEATMQTMFSGGSPGDHFLCGHTHSSLKRSLKEAGFKVLAIGEDGDDLVARCRKVVKL